MRNEKINLELPLQVSNLINSLEHKITDFFEGDASGHNIDHLKRTLSYALQLQEKEGGDIEVIAVSSFIHDVHRIMQTVEKRFVSPKESIPKIKELINDLPLTDKQKEHICFAIEHHEEYAFGKNGVSVKDIESLILQDADNLDVLGAMGIVRMVHYFSAHKIPLYVPTIPFFRTEFVEGQEDPSFAHHIYNKPLRLGENMNTKTAKNLAKPKTKLMQDFLDLLVEEFV